MRSSGVSRLTTFVRLVLVTGALALTSDHAGAQATAAPQFVMGGNQKTACEESLLKIDQLNGVIITACGVESEKASVRNQCMAKALKCKDAELDVFQKGDSSDDTNEEACQRARDLGCPENVSGTREDSTKDKKEAKEKRKELEKERDKANEDNNKQQEQQQQDNNKADEDALKEDQEYQKNRKEINDKLQKDLAEVDDAKLKAMKDAQESYDKLDVEYIKMRNTIRTLQSEVSNIDYSWKVTCRNAADSSARETEKALDERSAAEDKLIKNYQLSSAAGRNRRLLKQKRKKINNIYAQVLSRCSKGDLAPGAEMKMKLDATKNKLHDESALAADSAARLEKLRQQIVESMSQLQQSLAKKQAMTVQQAQEALQLADQSHQQNQQMAAKKKQQQQMQQMQKMMQGMQQSKKRDKDLDEAKADESNASARAMCAGGFSKESAADKRDTNKKINEAKGQLHSSCAGLANYSGCEAKMPPICKTLRLGADKEADESRASSSGRSSGGRTAR